MSDTYKELVELDSISIGYEPDPECNLYDLWMHDRGIMLLLTPDEFEDLAVAIELAKAKMKETE